MNYFLLVKSRPTNHGTNLALDDIVERSSTSSLFKWFKNIRDAFGKLSCEALLENPAAVNTSKHVIKKVVHECWLREGGGTAADIELANKLSHHLRFTMRNNSNKFSSVQCIKLNVLASPACSLRMHTQVTYMRKYHVKEWVHMNTNCIKRYEQEALSLFRAEVAPAFVLSKNRGTFTVANRFQRVCEYCKYVHNEQYVNDAFHVLFKCPMVSKERIVMFSKLDNMCGANEWERVHTLCDLGIILLSPQTVDTACVRCRTLSR